MLMTEYLINQKEPKFHSYSCYTKIFSNFLIVKALVNLLLTAQPCFPILKIFSTPVTSALEVHVIIYIMSSNQNDNDKTQGQSNTGLSFSTFSASVPSIWCIDIF